MNGLKRRVARLKEALPCNELTICAYTPCIGRRDAELSVRNAALESGYQEPFGVMPIYREGLGAVEIFDACNLNQLIDEVAKGSARIGIGKVFAGASKRCENEREAQ